MISNVSKFFIVVGLQTWRSTTRELNLKPYDNHVSLFKRLLLAAVGLRLNCTSRPGTALYAIGYDRTTLHLVIILRHRQRNYGTYEFPIHQVC